MVESPETEGGTQFWGIQRAVVWEKDPTEIDKTLLTR